MNFGGLTGSRNRRNQIPTMKKQCNQHVKRSVQPILVSRTLSRTHLQEMLKNSVDSGMRVSPRNTLSARKRLPRISRLPDINSSSSSWDQARRRWRLRLVLSVLANVLWFALYHTCALTSLSSTVTMSVFGLLTIVSTIIISFQYAKFAASTTEARFRRLEFLLTSLEHQFGKPSDRLSDATSRYLIDWFRRNPTLFGSGLRGEWTFRTQFMRTVKNVFGEAFSNAHRFLTATTLDFMIPYALFGSGAAIAALSLLFNPLLALVGWPLAIILSSVAFPFLSLSLSLLVRIPAAILAFVVSLAGRSLTRFVEFWLFSGLSAYVEVGDDYVKLGPRLNLLLKLIAHFIHFMTIRHDRRAVMTWLGVVLTQMEIPSHVVQTISSLVIQLTPSKTMSEEARDFVRKRTSQPKRDSTVDSPHVKERSNTPIVQGDAHFAPQELVIGLATTIMMAVFNIDSTLAKLVRPSHAFVSLAQTARDLDAVGRNIAPFMAETVNHIYRSVMGVNEPLIETKHGPLLKAIDAFIVKANDAIKNPARATMSQEDATAVTQLYTEFLQLFERARHEALPATSMSNFHFVGAQLRELDALAVSALASGVNRPVPVTFLISGPPGTGKTVLVRRLFETLNHTLWNAPVDPTTVWTLKSTMKHHDGAHNGLRYVVVDDFLQIGTEEAVAFAIDFLIRNTNNESHPCIKADLASKGREFFTNLFAGYSTNCTPQAIKACGEVIHLADIRAVMRRFHFQFRLSKPRADLRDQDSTYDDLEYFHGVDVNDDASWCKVTVTQAVKMMLKQYHEMRKFSSISVKPFQVEGDVHMEKSDIAPPEKAKAPAPDISGSQIAQLSTSKLQFKIAHTPSFVKRLYMQLRKQPPAILKARLHCLWGVNPMEVDYGHINRAALQFVMRHDWNSVTDLELREAYTESLQRADAMHLDRLRQDNQTFFRRHPQLIFLIGLAATLGVGGMGAKLLYDFYRSTKEDTEKVLGRKLKGDSHSRKHKEQRVREHKRSHKHNKSQPPKDKILEGHAQAHQFVHGVPYNRHDPGAEDVARSFARRNVWLINGDGNATMFGIGGRTFVSTYHAVAESIKQHRDITFSHPVRGIELVINADRIKWTPLRDPTPWPEGLASKVDTKVDAIVGEMPEDFPIFADVTQRIMDDAAHAELPRSQLLAICPSGDRMQPFTEVIWTNVELDVPVLHANIDGRSGFHTLDYFMATGHSKRGWSGSPVFIHNSSVRTRKLCGILTGSVEGGRVSFVPLYKEYFANIKHSQEHLVLPLETNSAVLKGEMMMSPQVKAVVPRGATVLGFLEPPYTTKIRANSRLKKTDWPLCGWSCPHHEDGNVCWWTECEHKPKIWVPAPTNRFTYHLHGRLHVYDPVPPLLERMQTDPFVAPLFRGQPLGEYIRNKVLPGLVRHALPPPIKGFPPEADVDVGINGYPGYDLFPPLQKGTSSGLPEKNLPPEHEEPGGRTDGKYAHLYCLEHGSPNKCPCNSDCHLLPREQVKARISLAVQMINEGRPPEEIWQVFLKDEPREPGKPPRLIAGCSIVYAVVCRMYLISLTAALMNGWREYPIKIGMQPSTRAFDEMVRVATAAEELSDAMTGDHRRWDFRILQLLHALVTEVIVLWHSYHSKGLDVPSFTRKITALLEPIRNPQLAFGDVLLVFDNILPTGNPICDKYNSLLHLVKMTSCWFMFEEDNGRVPTIERFLTEVRPWIYGDDYICLPTSVCKWDTVEYAAYSLKYFNSEIQPPSKHGELQRRVPYQEADFLCRRIKLVDGMYHAPLEERSRDRCLHFARDLSPDGYLQLANANLMECYQSGDRELFQQRRDAFRAYLSTAFGRRYILVEWLDCQELYLSARSRAFTLKDIEMPAEFQPHLVYEGECHSQEVPKEAPIVCAQSSLISARSVLHGICHSLAPANPSDVTREGPHDSELVSEQAELTQIVHGTPVVESVLQEDPQRIPHLRFGDFAGVHIETLKAIAERTITLAKVDWTAAQASNTDIVTVRAPYDLFNSSPGLQSHLAYFNYFRCRAVELWIEGSSSNFMFGSLLVWSEPYKATGSTARNYSIAAKANNRPLVLSASQLQAYHYELPTVHPETWIVAPNADSRMTQIGSIGITVLNALKNIEPSGSDRIPITVYGRFLGVEVTSPDSTSTLPMASAIARTKIGMLVEGAKRSQIILEGDAHSSKDKPGRKPPHQSKETPPSDEQKAADHSLVVARSPNKAPNFVNTLLSSALGGLTSVVESALPFAQGLIGPMLAAADKPDSLAAPSPVLGGENRTMTHMQGTDDAVALSGLPNDLMPASPMTTPDLKSIMQTPSLIAGFAVTSASSTTNVIWSVNVGPNLTWDSVAGDVHTITPSFLWYYSRLFRLWRGGIKLLFHFVTSAFTPAIFRLVYLGPNSATFTGPDTWGGEVVSELIEIKGETYHQVYLPFFNTKHMAWVPPVGSVVDPGDYFGGKLYLFLTNAPRVPSGSGDTTVYVNVWAAAGEDFEVSAYRGPSNVVNAEGAGILQGEAHMKPQENFAKPFRPIAKMAQSTVSSGISHSTEDTNLCSILHRYTFTGALNAAQNTLFVWNSTSWLYLVAPFKFHRGSVRFRIFLDGVAADEGFLLAWNRDPVLAAPASWEQYADVGMRPEWDGSVRTVAVRAVYRSRHPYQTTQEGQMDYMPAIEAFSSERSGQVFVAAGDDYGVMCLLTPPVVVVDLTAQKQKKMEQPPLKPDGLPFLRDLGESPIVKMKTSAPTIDDGFGLSVESPLALISKKR